MARTTIEELEKNRLAATTAEQRAGGSRRQLTSRDWRPEPHQGLQDHSAHRRCDVKHRRAEMHIPERVHRHDPNRDHLIEEQIIDAASTRVVQGEARWCRVWLRLWVGHCRRPFSCDVSPPSESGMM